MYSIKLTVRQLPREDIYKDLVRIAEGHRLDTDGRKVLEGTVCKITVKGGKSKLVSVRGFEGEETRILMDGKCRDDLGVQDKQEYEFQLRQTSWWGHCRWAWAASDPAYRIPARLCVVSVVLGSIGLALGIISLFPGSN